MRMTSLVCFSLLFLVTGCPSATDVCKSGVDQVCERTHECTPEAGKTTAQFQAAFGTSVADCKTKLYANPGIPRQLVVSACDARTDQNQNCAFPEEAGKSFDIYAAKDCKEARAALACDAYMAQLMDPTMSPARCNERCQ